ncbi:transglycosylase domain-containing protein [Streptomyces sp. NBC_01353]|uniref:transglycosylase domain-containing protein n=1 Tax=Streptomyces sp. NBC_01353 TaxID=2903835 RepID=UPI002E2F3BD3|nr:transglycosylase domain-containing protein [Streptomyces sp. NBC_01353]
MSDDQPHRPGWAPRDPTVPTPPPKRPRRSRPRRILRALLGTFLFTTLLLLGGLVAGYLLVDIPPANSAAIAQSNVYLYKDGTQIARDGEVNRENVRLMHVPATVRHAVLAAEDRDFYSDRAVVDPKAMVRAAWNTLTGKGRQSGSTITQQYVKNYYLGQEQTVTRKVKEFFIAIKLNREKSKDEIFEGYLNTSYFGRNAYGIQAAARAYYGKDAAHLDTAEGAYLASLLKAPSAYDLATHPENRTKALGRWSYVLDGMVKEKWLSPAERTDTAFPSPQTARPATGLSGQRGYLVQAVEEYLTGNDIVDEKTLAGGGFRITTTLEKEKQDAFVTAVEDQVMSKLDPARNPTDRFVRVGGAAIDPSTGRVLALYGGIDYTRQYVNNATRRDYQVGSTFKPFVLTAALQHGSLTQEGERITPNTYYDGTDKRPVQGWDGDHYAPGNEDDESFGDITVRSATDSSVNAVYAQMAVDVGPARVRETAVALGVPKSTPDLNASPSIALGPATASVLDMAEAYATLANHGRHGTYSLVARVTKDGQDLELPEAGSRQAVSREAADTTTSVLRSVVEFGSGTAALTAGRPAAGKTGTAEDDKAAWFAGYTPDLATVVTMMGQDPETGEQKSLYGALGLPRINGGGPPAGIWGQFTRDALAGTEPREFELELGDGAEESWDPTEPLRPDGSDASEEWEESEEGMEGPQRTQEHPRTPPVPLTPLTPQTPQTAHTPQRPARPEPQPEPEPERPRTPEGTNGGGGTGTDAGGGGGGTPPLTAPASTPEAATPPPPLSPPASPS